MLLLLTELQSVQAFVFPNVRARALKASTPKYSPAFDGSDLSLANASLSKILTYPTPKIRPVFDEKSSVEIVRSDETGLRPKVCGFYLYNPVIIRLSITLCSPP